MAEANSQFGRIKIAARGPQSEGIFKITAGGVVWRKAGGGRHIDIPVNDISSLRWTRVGKFCQLCVQRLREPSMTFVGFREQDYEGIAKMSQELLSKSVKQLQMTADGRNWGDARVNGSLLDFMATDSKLSFTVNLSDVVMAQLASNKNDVQLEFQTDDTSGKGIDSLCEMSVYVPPTHEEFATDEETPAPKNFLDTVLRKSNAGAVTSADAIITFHEIAVLAPRGRFDFEMHASFLKLLGQSQEFRVAYSSISRIFVLPKSAQHHVLVAISLDPPIRKGQTFYQHILCQFHSDEEETATLDISDELFQAKNERCGGKLQREFEGTKSDVFSRVLRGIAAAKITRTGNFRAVDGQSLALKCTYKAEQGHLYPLERAFFFVNKPPLLITHDEIESVEFQRQGRESMAAAKTFDLMMTLRNEQQYQFRNIEKNEWANLFEWAQAKNLRIENLAEAQQGPGGTANVALEIDDVGPRIRRPAWDLCFATPHLRTGTSSATNGGETERRARGRRAQRRRCALRRRDRLSSPPPPSPPVIDRARINHR
uniref:FACT complex subunit SSRP1 n=1 Tax=Tetraselmis sp. GSL018 TaxID=582737 RepID=A0A061RKA5_9CHLO